MRKKKITIIGAGIQGSCIALALAHNGVASTIIDKSFAPMQEASLKNEGKIHLGFVYANDNDSDTRKLMLKGALSFAPLIERWCGKINWQSFVSDGFNYAIMPDSICTASEIEKSYASLSNIIKDKRLNTNNYIGKELTYLWRKNTDLKASPFINKQHVENFYKTEEVSIDPRYFSKILQDKIRENKLINLELNTCVKSIEELSEYKLNCLCQGDRKEHYSDIIINCAWDDKERLDSFVNFPKSETNYRVKHQILIKPKYAISMLEPVTMVQGPYGDLVPWKDGSIYISWYPIGRTYFDKKPPKKVQNNEVAKKVAIDSLNYMSNLFPAIKDSKILSSKAGVILAKGSSDINKRESDLHKRNMIGIKKKNNWFSIDTGKYTTAPLFAEEITKYFL